MATYDVNPVGRAAVDLRIEVQNRIGEFEKMGLAETARFVRHLDRALAGEHPLDEVGMMAALAGAIERIERRVVALEALQRGSAADPMEAGRPHG